MLIRTRTIFPAKPRSVRMHPSLQQALDIITIERNAAEYTRAFAAVNDVVSVFGELDLANHLFAEIPRAVSEELVAELFDRPFMDRGRWGRRLSAHAVPL